VHLKDAFFVDGSWLPAEGRAPIPVVNPATEEQVASVPAGTEEDIDRAVAAARAAFSAWAATPASDRAALLNAAADALEKRTDEVAALITSEMGTPLGFSKMVQVGNPVRVLRSYASVLESYEFEEQIANSLVVKEPIGVVGAITPWNYPLHQVVAKVAAALAAGCTVVLKPSEVAPLSALSFTGSTAAGKRVMAVAADTVKKVSLELGGKSAFVVLDDADLGKAVKVALANCFINGGQPARPGPGCSCRPTVRRGAVAPPGRGGEVPGR
jgi:aldehyde dehydrogenase (NAD+)